jgi:uncharacterized membrane protein
MARLFCPIRPHPQRDAVSGFRLHALRLAALRRTAVVLAEAGQPGRLRIASEGLSMSKTRLEAFSDAVIAIIITIMVLEFQTPEGADWHALNTLTPVFLAYVLSFFYLAIYWNNHHHLLHAMQQVSGSVLWANMHLLFWLSLIPFATAWTGEHNLEPLPTAVYGVILLMCGIAYWILVHTIMACEGPHSRLRKAVGSDAKGKISILIYAAAIPLAYVNPWIADAMYLAVALSWLVPDRRIERTLGLKSAS